ncbi:hypothetical protein SDC9_147091 [bioreactor metagenome]|uniref:Uncharacterized protein n=1 Tax=bioreactor metagenome TaxID=1076179 RepID=A0A645EDT0_9ZZZZ
MPVNGGGRERCGAAGSHGQRGDGGGAVFHGDGVRRGDGVNLGRAGLSAARGGDGHLSAAGGGGENAVFHLTGAGAESIASAAHGNVIGIHGGGGHVYLAARQHVAVVRRDVKMAQLSAGLAGGHQKNLIAHRPLAAAGGTVDGFCADRVRLGGGEGGGPAAVQTQGGDTAQLDQPLGHLRHGRAYGIPGPASVDGVEHQRPVGLLAHRGAGVYVRGEAGNHAAVLHQRVQRAHGVLYVQPVTGGRRGGNADRGANGNVFHSVQGIGVRLIVDGQNHLPLRNGGARRVGKHAVHRQHQRAAV